jgi:CRISPR type I-E-associated protein CasB/Cse2
VSDNEPSFAPVGIARDWWRKMNFDGERRSGGAKRAALARLRRVGSPIEALLEPLALHLYVPLRNFSPERVGVLAGVLANVREDDAAHRSVARAIGRPSINAANGVLLSEGRFRRLLQAEGTEMLDAFRRLVRLMNGRAAVGDLAASILTWDERVKQRWIFDYYGVPLSLPKAAPRRDVAHPTS